MEKKNIIKEKSFIFAIEIVGLYKVLVERKEFVLSKQLLRSGTSIGANVRVAEHAQSKKDFIHKLSISLKEANETEYWLDLLFETKYLTEEEFQSVKYKIIELLKTKKGKNRLNDMKNLVKSVNYCQKSNHGCGNPVPKIKAEKKKSTIEINIIAEYAYPINQTQIQLDDNIDKKPVREVLTPMLVYNILKNISTHL